jgi:hypothetical protein
MAAWGYLVQQNPSQSEVADARMRAGDVGKPDSRPDYLVEGRVFDCYAPRQPRSARGIWSEVSNKVEREQTQRVVVNLQDWGNDLHLLRNQFTDWPINGLKEVKAVTTDRQVVSIWHAKEAH